MVQKGGGGGSGGSSSGKEKKEEHKYKFVDDAKDLLDRIGEDIYKIANEAALPYNDALQGRLRGATFSNNHKITSNDPCHLNYNYDTYVTSKVINPCEHKKGKRLSEVHNGECDKKKIKDSEKDSEGACAPFRRLHVCDKNLEQIDPDKIESTHNLLVDVCLAAQFEGESIKGYHDKYQVQYPSSGSTICTALARSFADIGDIIRGKDLYFGNNKKDKLQEQLKKYFKNIYDNLEGAAKNHYNGDYPNYYQLREDWWERNRKEVWKALTCHAGQNAQYFRHTCGTGEKRNATNHDCRCTTNDVPTYFDYVPQYLRWFEEWAEDFCRKRKKKLEDAIKICRGENGTERYCDLNGYDCKQTVRGKEKYNYEQECIECSFSCDHFVHWIDNQQKEYDKQKKKYAEEITKKHDKTITIGKTTINNIYAKEFYEKLREDYGNVEEFLKKLSKEGICQSQPTVGKETASPADFTINKIEKTFDHTTYCQACPWCGVEPNGPPWVANDMSLCPQEKEKTFNKENTTDIEILSTDKGKSKILEKLKTFCRGNKEINYDIWKCHYEKNKEYDEGAGKDYCVLQDKKKDTQDRRIMPYEAFFNLWINQMLDDSIKWRKEYSMCIKNEKSTKCIGACKKPCECFAKWIEQKKKEWKFMEKHFDQQEDLKGIMRNITLKTYLEELFKEKIEEAYGKEESKELMQKINKIDMSQVIGNIENSEDAIKILLEHEAKEAQKCKETHNEDKCESLPPPPPINPAGNGGPGRSQTPAATTTSANPTEEEDHENTSDEEEDLGDDAEDEVEEDTAEPHEDGDTTEGPKEVVEETVAAPEVKSCDIVANVLTIANLKQVCDLKYGSKSHVGWKCVTTTSSGDKGERGAIGDSGGSSERAQRARRSVDKSGKDSSGSICIPPRRRKLYIHKLPDDGHFDTTASLRDWFVKSAAVETFFLWDTYKKIKLKEKQEERERNGLLPQLGPFSGTTGEMTAGVGIPVIPGAGIPEGAQLQQLQPLNGGTLGDSGEQTPEKMLQSGNIPPDFLKLMFYTLGDYRDILFGNTGIVVEALSSSDKENMQKIQEKIQQILPKNGGTSLVPKPGNTTPQQWWETNGQHIWNGMICALTYKEDGAKDTPPTQDEEVKKALLDGEGKKPQKHQYEYKNVKLQEETNGPMLNNTPSSSDTPLLSHFISRPPYFRWLEEWGETFCRERKKRLEQIKEDCEVDEDGPRGRGELKQKYSGDGYYCDIKDISEKGLFAELDKPSCGKHCSSYRKWIERKKDEYDEQKNAYNQEKKDATTKSGDISDQYFVKNLLNGYSSIDSFLDMLKNGPCKTDNKKYEIDFKEPDKTFRNATNCGTCSEFTVKCNGNGKCSGDGTKVKCTGRTIFAKDIETIVKPTDINMLVSDNNIKKYDDLKDACEHANIFKGLRKDEWKCGKFCGVDICTLEKTNNGQGKEHIIVKELLKRWLEYFFEDYNRIQKKVKACTKSDQGSTCIKGCVDKWIEKKTKEWQKINDTYLEQYKNDDGNTLTNFLEQFEQRTEFKNAIKPCERFVDFEKSKECAVDASSEKESGKQDKKSDIIDCLLKKLAKKAEKCKTKHSGETCTDTAQPKTLDDETFDNDIEIEEAKKNMMPTICKDVVPTEETEEKGTCNPAERATEPEPEPQSETKSSEEPAKIVPEKKVPVTPPKKPEVPPPKVPETAKKKEEKQKPVVPQPPGDDPWEPLKNAMLSNTIMWSIGIGFAAFIYFVLKKKTKSTIDLFRVINIPKGDYGIPTLKSSNRYIPYGTNRYKGKTYIYMEGDSGDEKYIGNISSSDITSSESEYEEFDINDIYPYKSPKYKTLIEVVLEPSKKDIQSDDTPTNKFTDNEWNELKNDFITNILQNEQNDIPNNNINGNTPLNTHLNTLYFDNPEEKPFITSIHDRNLYSGEEISYNINMTNNDVIPISDKNDTYSGIDLINDSLNSDQHIDIYDEVLKRKENELFGTNHTKKNTSSNSVAKNTNSDPVLNQINLFHKWLNRHRNNCEKWKNKEDILNKLKEEWNKENNNNVDKTYNSDNKPSHNHVLNTDVSIQIDMDNPKTKNEITNMDTNPDKSTMDTILDDLEKYNEPYYYDFYEDDIIYHDVDVEKSSMDDIYVDHNNVTSNNMDVPTKMHIEMNIVNNKKEIFEEEYPISDIWNI